MKNIPILRKKVKDLIKELNLSPAEVLKALDPILDETRRKSSAEVESDVAKWKAKHGLPRIKTDY